MGRRDLNLNLCLKQRPRLMLCCSKADRGILIGRLLQVNRYLHIGPPISTAPRVASTFAGRGAASAASIVVILFSDSGTALSLSLTLPLWASPASGPLLPASAGSSAHLFPPFCLLFLCGLCSWPKRILALTRQVKLGWGCLLV